MSVKSHLKTVLKTASWRVVGAVDTFAIAYFLTGHTVAAAGMVGLEVLTKSVWFYFHERAWEHSLVAGWFASGSEAA